jgi:putative nucleotidyltransferase with HDIG domain
MNDAMPASATLKRRAGAPPPRRSPASVSGRARTPSRPPPAGSPPFAAAPAPAPTTAPAANPGPVPWSGPGLGVARYLPAAVLATLSVTVLPALAVQVAFPPGGVGRAIAGAACAVAISLGLAALEASAWKHVHGGRGIVFSELMLWSFARRLWAERRLRSIASAYKAAATGGEVRVELLACLSRLLETRNPYTYGHCRRVARHAERIALAMRLSAAEVAEVRAAALVHDVGKLYTPVAILHKAGPLSDEEFGLVKRHSKDGAEMLAPVRDRGLAAIVRHHHERIDGSGYPDGLKGEQIPLGARIVAVADTFDAITSHRPYRRARSQSEGLQVLSEESGEKLDAAAVAAFLDVYTPRRALASVSLSTALWSRLAPGQLLPGGLLGGASLAGVLPAVGAAGLLAVAPATRYERAARPAAPSSGAALLAPALRGGLGAPFAVARPLAGPAPRLRAPAPLRVGARPAPRRRSASGRLLPATAPHPDRGVPQAAPTGDVQRSGGDLLPGAAVNVPVPAPAVPAPAVPSPGAVPPAATRAAEQPSVTVGPVRAPSVALGSGGAPVGPVETPGVTVGSAQAPAVSLPEG